jgi:excisionase family DNA binding protein
VTLLGSLLSPAALDELRSFFAAEIAAALAARNREPAKRWLTPREAGAYLGCSERAVYQRIRRGRIPEGAIRHQGRSLLIDRQALDRVLERA